MQPFKNSIHRASRSSGDLHEFDGGYLSVQEGTWLQINFVGTSGEEIGWLYGLDILNGSTGWFATSVLPAFDKVTSCANSGTQSLEEGAVHAKNDFERVIVGTVGIAVISFDAHAQDATGYLDFDLGDRILIDYVGDETSDDQDWAYGYLLAPGNFLLALYGHSRVGGWFPKSCVILLEAVNDHVWLASSTKRSGTSAASSGRTLVIGGDSCRTDCWEKYGMIEELLQNDFDIDLLLYSSRCCCTFCGGDDRSRDNIYDVAVALLLSRCYKACAIPEGNFLAPIEFLTNLSTWVRNGGVALMASWRCGDPMAFCTDDVVRECFGKTWITENSESSSYINPESAEYNSEWFHNETYTKLQGNVENISKLPDPLCMSGTLWDVALGERVFDSAFVDPSVGDPLCAVASGRVDRGQVCVYAGSECAHVLATLAKIPPAVFWSDIRPFILALSQSGGSRRAVPMDTSGLFYNFCNLKLSLAQHILNLAFGPVHVPQ